MTTTMYYLILELYLRQRRQASLRNTWLAAFNDDECHPETAVQCEMESKDVRGTTMLTRHNWVLIGGRSWPAAAVHADHSNKQ